MSARLREVVLHNSSVAPAAAEVWVRAVAEPDGPGLELRGRLVGPRCRFAATIEVAYPLRPFVETPPGFAGLAGRVTIPEASLWDPESPFLYRGLIELWRDGRLCDRATVEHGLRAMSLTAKGLFVNDRLVALHGREVAAITEAEALALRAGGCNLLIVPVSEATVSLWALADHIGFLILGRLADADHAARAQLGALCRCSSCLGWLVDAHDAHHAAELSAFGFIGVVGADSTDLPAGVRFLIDRIPATTADVRLSPVRV
jgi:hypothetical protein